jgi:hypothetical protein
VPGDRHHLVAVGEQLAKHLAPDETPRAREQDASRAYRRRVRRWALVRRIARRHLPPMNVRMLA